jgi:regulator of replication initiation timing
MNTQELTEGIKALDADAERWYRKYREMRQENRVLREENERLKKENERLAMVVRQTTGNPLTRPIP